MVEGNRYIFFLGGHDAEMLEIRRILESEGIPYVDKHLNWGAVLSDYRDELIGLSEGDIPVLIELEADMALPPGAIVVDHHGPAAGKEKRTSLEQTADLLGVTLDRRGKLISANDRGHIRAMEALGASAAEISEIRSLDRQAQGVTGEDERLAALSLKNRARTLPDQNAIIVDSLTEKASPITDRIHGQYEHMVIYTPSGGMLYFGLGIVIRKLVDRYRHLAEMDKDIRYWYGGELPERGFFGSNRSLHEKEMIATLTEG